MRHETLNHFHDLSSATISFRESLSRPVPIASASRGNHRLPGIPGSSSSQNIKDPHGTRLPPRVTIRHKDQQRDSIEPAKASAVIDPIPWMPAIFHQRRRRHARELSRPRIPKEEKDTRPIHVRLGLISKPSSRAISR